MEILIQRLCHIRYAEHFSPHIIKAVGYVRKQNRLIRIEKSHKKHGKDVVGTDPDEYLLVFASVDCSYGVYKILDLRIRIEPHTVHIQ